jgi:hypothetical protein
MLEVFFMSRYPNYMPYVDKFPVHRGRGSNSQISYVHSVNKFEMTVLLLLTTWLFQIKVFFRENLCPYNVTDERYYDVISIKMINITLFF